MIGVTIGTGAWEGLARQTAARMAEMTGLECRVITGGADCVHPSWLKCHIHRMFPQEGSFLVFDADILPLRPWDPAALFEEMGRAFCAVPEPPHNPDLMQECREWGLGYPDVYVNGGLMIYGREHGPMWDRVWSHHPNGGRWLEQTALNHALTAERIEMCRLPRRFNLIAQQGKINGIYARATLADAVNVHTCALNDPAKVEAIHDSILAYHESGQAGRTRWELIRTLPKHSTGAELGVLDGVFSRQILAVVDPSRLHLVDLFEGKVISGDHDGRYHRRIDMAAAWCDLCAEMPAHVTPVMMDSIEWLRLQPENSLDWVYIDTSHDHRTITEIREAARVVRPGGYICGHDFSRAFPDVFAAVLGFKKKTGCPLEIFDGDLLPSYRLTNLK